MPKPERDKDSARALGVKAARSTLIYTVGNIIGSSAVLLLLIILARLLKPTDFGIYAIAIAFYTLLSIGGHFGMGTALRKEVPQILSDRKRVAELISNSYVVALAVALVVALVAMALSNAIAIGVYHDPGISNTLVLASLLVLLYALFNLTLAALISVEKVREGTMIYLMYAFIQLVAAAALVLLGYGVFGAMVGLGIGLIVPSLIGLYKVASYINWKFVMPSRGTIRHLMGFSAPVVASNVAVQGPPNLAILLLGVYSTAIIVGNYNAAFKFGNFVNVFLVANAFILLPSFAIAFSDRNLSSKIGRIYNSSIHYTLILMLPVIIFAISVARPLMRLLFSAQYSVAPFYFTIIVLGTALGIISTYAGNLIVSYGDTKRFMIYQLIGVSLQIILLLVLTPMMKAVGVLLSLFVISPILLDMLYMRALYRQFSFRHSIGSILRLVLPALMLMALLYSVTLLLHSSVYSLLTNAALVALLFPPLAVAFGGIKRENTEMIREISKSLRVEWIASYIVNYTEMFMRDKSIKLNRT
ncbi:MAG: oligosaccharide flippase family protein [Candidatus Micrarchaeota archaeon]|nr:oligosaccharide flippase family protein [Candidatus Micrarchaeota archaeon]